MEGCTLIQLSCPGCNSLIPMEMSVDELSKVFRTILGETEQYCYKGIKSCDCGKMVVSCLTVSAYEIDTI